ncbi:inorganic diphosphatase [Ktedonobacter robiniae]|uniref:Inorganic pyrophosphatase domain-containing protein n=1 Tax=Ktedonobacter robiniae TaxID=2778365 RepID=A0ABQ3UIW9_9CHLR|nr:inorganic diphosphatase [Ktedonobacter robiniae]GHO52565.1 hypothetical protein KSB_10400 [Ktedonobacter robiniae]
MLTQLEGFWQALDDLVANSEIVIDRPRGSRHPRYEEMIYPYDYGYLQGTRAADGDGIDVWVGTQQTRQMAGLIVCVDVLKRDSEIKILLGCTREEMEQILAQHNSGLQVGMLIERS